MRGALSGGLPRMLTSILMIITLNSCKNFLILAQIVPDTTWELSRDETISESSSVTSLSPVTDDIKTTNTIPTQEAIVIPQRMVNRSENSGDKIPLHLMGFASVEITSDGWSSAGVIPAIEMALIDVNARDDILTDYELRVDMKDSKCDPGRSVQALYEHLSTEPTKIMILGGGCSVATAPVARTAPLLGLVQMGYSAASPDLSRRDYYRTFFRTAVSDLAMNRPIIALLLRHNWRHMATIHEQDPLFSSYEIKLITAESFQSDPEPPLVNIKRKNARIIFFDGYEGLARRTFCTIYKLKMYGPKYQWIIPGWYSKDWLEINDTADCNVDQIKKAVQHALTVTDLKGDLTQTKTVSGQTYAEYEQRYLTWPSVSRYGVNAYHSLGYDAVWAVALALNSTLTSLAQWNVSEVGTDGVRSYRSARFDDFTYSEKSNFTPLIFDAVSQVEFHGVSGPVSFELGERKAVAEVRQIIGEDFRRIAKFVEADKELTFLNGFDIEWKGAGPPVDVPTFREEIMYNRWLVVVTAYALSCAGVLMACAFLCFNLLNTDHLHIRMSSPRLNNLVAMGSLLAYASVALCGLDTRLVDAKHMNILCPARTWSISIAFTLAYGAMFAKTWRVHAVFTTMTVKTNRAAHDIHLLAMVATLLVIDLSILISWQVVDPQYHAHQNASIVEEDDFITAHVREYCSCQYPWHWAGPLYAVKGILLIFGCFLAYETRTIKLSGLNDSRYVGLSVYNVVVLCIVGMAVSLTVKDMMTVTFAFQASCIFLCSTTTLCLLFIPKISFVRRYPEQRIGDNKFGRGSSNVNIHLPGQGTFTFQHTMRKLKKEALQASVSIDCVLATGGLPKELVSVIKQREHTINEQKQKIQRLESLVDALRSPGGCGDQIGRERKWSSGCVQKSSDIAKEMNNGEGQGFANAAFC